MSWFSKLSQRSGYCDFQLDSGGARGNITGTEHACKREAEIFGAKIEFMGKAKTLGHDMKPWSNINTAYCKQCSKRLELPIAGNSSKKLSFSDDVLAGPCDHRGVPTPRELPWSEMNATLWY